MDTLCKDLQMMIWRYVRNNSYDEVVRQFIATYLNGIIVWDDTHNMYTSKHGYKVANWREGHFGPGAIYRLHTGRHTRVHTNVHNDTLGEIWLPINY